MLYHDRLRNVPQRSARRQAVTEESRPRNRRPLISHQFRKRSLTMWLMPLGVILAIIIFLPKLVELLEK